eukprot:TRINITY_DN7962_c0_g1_i2.p1 TRINITY_DN7962_c0_g1~~TRINITY_DN7962_c0_g1_i2.p1  ORF type:complete len:464 (+),score=178.23 TRINITY_DN7962_c0_g1_i2:787-2178(+)
MQNMIWQHDSAKSLLQDLIEMTESNIELAVSASCVTYSCTSQQDLPDVLATITPVFVEIMQLDPYSLLIDAWETSMESSSSSSSSTSGSSSSKDSRFKEIEKDDIEDVGDNETGQNDEDQDDINDVVDEQLDSILFLVGAHKLAIQTVANICSDLDSRGEDNLLADLLDRITAVPSSNSDDDHDQDDETNHISFIDALTDRIPSTIALEERMGDLSEDTKMAEAVTELFELQLDQISCFNNLVITFGGDLVATPLEEWNTIFSILEYAMRQNSRRWNLVQECTALMWSLLRLHSLLADENQDYAPSKDALPVPDQIALVLDILSNKNAPTPTRIDATGMISILHATTTDSKIIESMVSDLVTIAKEITSKKTKPKTKQLELLIESLNAIIDIFAADEWNDIYINLDLSNHLSQLIDVIDKAYQLFSKSLSTSDQDIQIFLDRFEETMENMAAFVEYMEGSINQ